MAGPIRILVVDDNDDMRALCRTILEQDGFEVREAVDGDEALEALASPEPPDLVLLDIMMPERSGWGVVAAMRQDPNIAKVPIVILTARADDDFRMRAGDLGLAYLTKPFYNRELLNQVRHMLQHGPDVWG